MVLCGPCEKECNDGSIKCTGGCERSFHLNCVSNDSDGKIKRSTKDWKFSGCRTKFSSQGSVKSTTSSSDFLFKVLEEFKKDVFSEMTSFKSEMSEISTSVQYVSDKLDASTLLMEEVRSKFDELQKENILLKAKNETLSKEVIDLQERMRNLEQYSRVKNIQISGLPVTKNENVSELVADLGAALGVEMKETDFSTKGMKEQWITKARQKKSLTARDVNQHFPIQRVYINDHLSPENKLFLAKLKQKGRDIGYKFVWSRDGKFFARKAEGDPVKKIVTYEDLDKLK
ncbi:uncharacterized protein LOC124365423 [Homalodisca vitripennis]|uniref:uncharacterized protein LOC124365423 n=1 Tax=Homalodisca vitripennis TaxID=197043 RepID=UPI001EEAE473|nr:uncharacterized protein LOC124365423 [Homalodisca vitripennis]